MKYRSDIDGLRAVAILPVLFFHSGLSLFAGGFVGVDVFFVISGYLITTILRDDMEAGRYTLLDFYERRVRRILPALIATVTVTFIGCWWLFLPSHFLDFSKSLISVSGFVSNIYFWKYSGYFDSTAQLRPLLHTWSLGVEEQFYIFMPLFMFAVHKYANRFKLIIFSLVAISSLLLSIYCTKVAPTANFFLLPTRAFELLVGSLMAISRLRVSKSTRLNSALGILGLLLIVGPVFSYSEATPFPGLAALPPCLGCALLIYAGQDTGSVAARGLSWPPLVGVGKISYSLYLVHWPVAVFVRYFSLSNPTLISAFFVIVTSIILATVQWRFVEARFRDRTFIRSRAVLLTGAVTSLLVLACVGLAGVNAKGFPDRFKSLQSLDSNHLDNGWREGQCFFQDFAYENWSSQNCLLTSGHAENALLWGDSFAAHYAPGISANQNHIGYNMYEYAAAGCPPVLDYYSYARVKCTAFNRNALTIIKQLHIKKVILSARWVDLQHHGLGGLRKTLKTLRSTGADVFVIGQSPVFVTEVDLIAFRMSKGNQSVDKWPDGLNNDLNLRLAAQIQSLGDPHIRFVDPRPFLCDATGCTYRVNGRFSFGDNGHFTPFGSNVAVTRYFPLVNR